MEICPLYFHHVTTPVRSSAGNGAKTQRVYIITKKSYCRSFAAFSSILLILNALYFKSLHAFLHSPTSKKLWRLFGVSTNVLCTPTSASPESFFQSLIPSAGSHTCTCTDTDLYTSPINARL